MFFTKYPSPANFSFAKSLGITSGELLIGKRTAQLDCTSYEGGIHQVSLSHPDIWPSNRCLAPLDIPKPAPLGVRAEGDTLVFCDEKGNPVLEMVPGGGIGLNGQASVFQFSVAPGARYYGMGEKNFGVLELSGYRSVFWNTDVWSDFHFGQWWDKPADPSYCSLPYLAVKLSGGGFVGLLLHNPSPTFMETPGRDDSRVFVHWQATSENLILGAYDGEPHLWILTDATLAGLTRKLQKLVGLTPLPPIWSLGYQQSRWGYEGHHDLLELDKQFAKFKIPCSGLWLDLDYMDGYRIFQTDLARFPKTVKATSDALAKNDRRIVPIIDPGVKFEPGYRVYDDGHKNLVFCTNPEGQEYIGMVWPGKTVFPDFTQARVREWWQSYVVEFRLSGFGACWVDMNDPSTGPIEPNDMLFENGTRTHAEHRNQYGLGMQMATFDGFLKAAPNERPFILSRSGFIGSSRYSAIWTGDNCANDFHLKLAITTSLGMSLSGLPFSGCDLGGFGGDTSALLMTRWEQACFLFPFCRNHSTKDTAPQEPYAYPAATRKILAHFIRLRYQFLPYLYHLFGEQAEKGDPILRPLFYEFPDASDQVTDEFMVGPDLLQAPIVQHEDAKRTVTLPGKDPWWCAMSGAWIVAGDHKVTVIRAQTPLYLRAGALIPMQQELPESNRVDLRNPTILVAIPAGWSGERELVYRADDGLTYDYQAGRRSVLRVLLTAKNGKVSLETLQTEDGFGPIAPQFRFVSDPGSFMINGIAQTASPTSLILTGRAVTVFSASKEPIS